MPNGGRRSVRFCGSASTTSPHAIGGRQQPTQLVFAQGRIEPTADEPARLQCHLAAEEPAQHIADGVNSRCPRGVLRGCMDANVCDSRYSTHSVGRSVSQINRNGGAHFEGLFHEKANPTGGDVVEDGPVTSVGRLDGQTNADSLAGEMSRVCALVFASEDRIRTSRCELPFAFDSHDVNSRRYHLEPGQTHVSKRRSR